MIHVGRDAVPVPAVFGIANGKVAKERAANELLALRPRPRSLAARRRRFPSYCSQQMYAGTLSRSKHTHSSGGALRRPAFLPAARRVGSSGQRP